MDEGPNQKIYRFTVIKKAAGAELLKALVLRQRNRAYLWSRTAQVGDELQALTGERGLHH